MTACHLSKKQYNTTMVSLCDFNIFLIRLSYLLLSGLGLLLPLNSLADVGTQSTSAAPVTITTTASNSTPSVTSITALPTAPLPDSATAVSVTPTATTAIKTTPLSTTEIAPATLAITPSTITPTPDGLPNTISKIGPNTVAPANLWDRIRMGFGMNASDSPLIETHINWYANRPDYVSRMVERSKRYLFHILAEVQKRGMPTEIALLPMIESAYNPMAYSASHASGIWQFVPATGKDFGLRQTGWYDGRRDIIAATDAALDYLGKLHTQFGSWELALAAYNCGEGCVAHAIAKNQALGLPTDYANLSLPSETRHYVPKLLAIKQIIADPTSVGLSLDSIPDQAYFTAVTLHKSMDVSLAAKLANMPMDDFISLNPAYNKPVIRSDTSAQLLLPVDKADAFATNLQNYNKPLVTWQIYTAKLGERIKAIARKFHVSVAWLMANNPIHLSHKGKLTSSHTLLVPLHDKLASAGDVTGSPAIATKIAYHAPITNTDVATDTSASIDSESKKLSTPVSGLIKIKSGDTLYSIAKHYQLSMTDLQKWNNIRHQHLKPGQILHISAPVQQHIALKQTSRHKKSGRTASAKLKKNGRHQKYASKTVHNSKT